jgi:thiamine transport system ATP-binding protein
MLTLDGLHLRQGDFSLTAKLAFAPGLTAIIGPSGGGKSTLLAALAGFLKPVAGAVLWDGVDLARKVPGDRPISMLFQDNNLFPHLSVAQNVGLGVDPRLKLDAPAWGRVSEMLASVDLAGFEDRLPAQLSGGQQSRVALARVLVAARPVVLLDEPFAALGPALKAEMLALVRATLVAKGQTVLMVTHDPEDARRFADAVCVIADGVVYPPRVTDDAFGDPSAALRDYLGAVD